MSLVPTGQEEVRQVWPETSDQAFWYHKLGATRPNSNNAFSRAPSALQEMMYAERRCEQSRPPSESATGSPIRAQVK
jgi:hypothetical protein